MLKEYKVALIAGGTGGHLFAATAAAQELQENVAPVIVTDLTRFPLKGERIIIPRMPFTGSFKHKLRWMLFAPWQLIRLVLLYKKLNIRLVVGFGGYTAFVPCIAAKLLGLPIILHEQNSLLGKVNELIANYANLLSLGFPGEVKVPEKIETRRIHTTNPIRREVIEGALKVKKKSSPFSILVIGGSQGAHVFDSIVPKALELLGNSIEGIRISQQCSNPKMIQTLKESYQRLGLEFELEPFFTDMSIQYAKANLVICRSGASTLEELVKLQMPAVLIPLPSSANDHQRVNAKYFSSRGAAWYLEQGPKCHEELASIISSVMTDKGHLKDAKAELAKIRATRNLTLAKAIMQFMQERRI